MFMLTIALIVVAITALAALEVWLFWQLGEREDRRRAAKRMSGQTSRNDVRRAPRGPLWPRPSTRV